MIRYMQTRYGSEGNCLEACLAGILHQDLDTMPDLDGSMTCEAAMRICRDAGYLPCTVALNNIPETGPRHRYAIAAVSSTSPEYWHAVIAEEHSPGAFEIIHDPDHHTPHDHTYEWQAVTLLLKR